MPRRMPREQGWPTEAPPASREAARPHYRTRCGGMNAAEQASYETTPSCPRKILGAAWARSGQPLKVGQDSATTDRRDLGVTPVSQQSRSRFRVPDGLLRILPIGSRDEGHGFQLRIAATTSTTAPER